MSALETDSGHVLAVAVGNVGTALSGDHTSGATSLTLIDCADLDDTNGGQLVIDGVTYTYAGVNDEASTVAIAPGLTSSQDDQTPVYLLDPLTNLVATEAVASVTLDGTDPGDVLQVHVRSSLMDRLVGGVRGIVGESVTLERDEHGTWEVVDIIGHPSSRPLAFIDTDNTVASANNASVIFALTHTPIDGSLHVRKNGVSLRASEWALADAVATIAPTSELVIRTGDKFSAAYAYDGVSAAMAPTNGRYDAAVLAESTLLGYWRHAESSGTVMVDSSGHGRDGVYSSDVILGQSPILVGDPDTAAGFHGPNARGVVASASWMNVATFTVETWIKIDAISSGIQAIINRDTQGRSWLLQADSGGNARFETLHSSPASSVKTATLDDTSKHMIAAVYDGSHITIYVDGVALGSPVAATGDQSVTADLAIGASYAGDVTWWVPYYFKGKLSKSALYSGAQSAASILNRYQIGAGL